MDWIHLHLALNHVPVVGTAFVAFLPTWSWARRNREVLQLSLWLCVLLSAASVGIKFTGDFALQAIGKPTPDYDYETIQRHEQSADQATTGAFVLGVVAAIARFISRGGKPTPKWVLALVVVMALATFTLMARTANFGGRIRHSELHSGVSLAP
jgi:hypothetical protein